MILTNVISIFSVEIFIFVKKKTKKQLQQKESTWYDCQIQNRFYTV